MSKLSAISAGLVAGVSSRLIQSILIKGSEYLGENDLQTIESGGRVSLGGLYFFVSIILAVVIAFILARKEARGKAILFAILFYGITIIIESFFL